MKVNIELDIGDQGDVQKVTMKHNGQEYVVSNIAGDDTFALKFDKNPNRSVSWLTKLLVDGKEENLLELPKADSNLELQTRFVTGKASMLGDLHKNLSRQFQEGWVQLGSVTSVKGNQGDEVVVQLIKRGK